MKFSESLSCKACLLLVVVNFFPSSLKHTSCNAFSIVGSNQLTNRNTPSNEQAGLQSNTKSIRLGVMSMNYDVTSESSESSSSKPEPESSNHPPAPECASLLPGQVVSIRIGDTSLARKAWKKRRRSGSPILVPCTILGMNRDLMVKNNLINLLHRFGKTNNSSIYSKNSNKNNNGVTLSVGAIVKLYKHRLGGNLIEHVKALGYKTIVAYMKATFDGNDSKDNGVQMIRIGARDELALTSPLSLRLAREAAYKAEFVQFVINHSEERKDEEFMMDDYDDDDDEEEEEEENDDDFFPELSVDYDDDDDEEEEEDDEHDSSSILGGSNQMIHSGTTFQFHNNHEKYQTIAEMDTSAIQPLSAAVRIASADEITTRITTGMECNAFVHSFEPEGDNGSPLLICAIDPPREQIRDQLKRRAYVRKKMNQVNNDQKLMKRLDGGEEGSGRDLKDLNAGDGPFQATVIRVSERSGAAFVDLGVSRQKGKKHGGGEARVLGMLRFEDVTQSNDGMTELGSSECTSEEAAIIEASILEGSSSDEGVEIEEDVSDMYFIDEDGNVSMLDGDSQSSQVIGSIHDNNMDEDFDDQDDDDDNMFAGMSPEERLHAIGEMLAKEEAKEKETSIETEARNQKSGSLQVGDEVEVFVRAVFPQSGRFMVTTDNNVMKLKDAKQAKEADKRLERLTAKMGGESGIKKILDLHGEEMEGEIKATSKSGDWYYVQPISDFGLPVGIAACDIEESFSSGDKVQILMDGIDYSRGQLSLKIVKRL